MKVYNLTDVHTEVLVQRNLVDQHIAVHTRMVAPGEYADVEETGAIKAGLEYLLQVGAVSIDSLPPPYVEARKLRDASKGHARLAHVTIPETRVAHDPPVRAQPAVEGATQVLKVAEEIPATIPLEQEVSIVEAKLEPSRAERVVADSPRRRNK